jgi:hypothetical protein
MRPFIAICMQSLSQDESSLNAITMIDEISPNTVLMDGDLGLS